MPNIRGAQKNGRDGLISNSRTGTLGVGLEYRTRLNLYPQLSNFAIWGSGTFTTTRRTLGMPLGSVVNIGTYPSSAIIMQIASSSANDTGAGTGARTVTLQGLDLNFEKISEALTLTGQTPKSTVNSYRRLNRIFVDETGSGTFNDGDLYISDSSDTFIGGIPQTRVYCAAIAGENSDTWGHFTTKKNSTLFYAIGNHYNNATSDSPILLEERYTSPNFIGGRTDYTSGALWYTGNTSYNFQGAGPIFGPTDIQWTGTSATGVREGAVYYESVSRDDVLDFDNTFSFTQPRRGVFG